MFLPSKDAGLHCRLTLIKCGWSTQITPNSNRHLERFLVDEKTRLIDLRNKTVSILKLRQLEIEAANSAKCTDHLLHICWLESHVQTKELHEMVQFNRISKVEMAEVCLNTQSDIKDVLISSQYLREHERVLVFRSQISDRI